MKKLLSGLLLSLSLVAWLATPAITQQAQKTQDVTVQWNWQDTSAGASNETHYVLERCQGAGCTNFAVVQAKIPADTTQVIDIISGDTGGNVYTYRLTAVNAAGPSPFSNIATITTPAIMLVPNAPQGLIGVVIGTKVNQ